MKELSLILLCYFIGSIPFSYIFSRMLKGVDIRNKGSHNVGATNVLRTSGVGVALAAVTGDLGKGLAAAWIGQKSGIPAVIIGCCMAAIIGHCWPVFLGFKGGKGVATAAGIILFNSPVILIILLAIFIFAIVISRYVSLGSMCAAVSLPVLALVLHQQQAFVIVSFLMAALVIAKHHQNIRNLIMGTERKITEHVS